jgi:hypothetical protein
LEPVAELTTLAVKVHTLTEVIGFMRKFAESCQGMVLDSPVFELCNMLVRGEIFIENAHPKNRPPLYCHLFHAFDICFSNPVRGEIFIENLHPRNRPPLYCHLFHAFDICFLNPVRGEIFIENVYPRNRPPLYCHLFHAFDVCFLNPGGGCRITRV